MTEIAEDELSILLKDINSNWYDTPGGPLKYLREWALDSGRKEVAEFASFVTQAFNILDKLSESVFTSGIIFSRHHANNFLSLSVREHSGDVIFISYYGGKVFLSKTPTGVHARRVTDVILSILQMCNADTTRPLTVFTKRDPRTIEYAPNKDRVLTDRIIKLITTFDSKCYAFLRLSESDGVKIHDSVVAQYAGPGNSISFEKHWTYALIEAGNKHREYYENILVLNRANPTGGFRLDSSLPLNDEEIEVFKKETKDGVFDKVYEFYKEMYLDENSQFYGTAGKGAMCVRIIAKLYKVSAEQLSH